MCVLRPAFVWLPEGEVFRNTDVFGGWFKADPLLDLGGTKASSLLCSGFLVESKNLGLAKPGC